MISERERELNTVPPKTFSGPRSTFLMKFSLLPHLDSQTFPFFHQPGSAISAGGSSSNGSRRGKTYGYRVVSHQSQVDESLFGEPQAQQMRQNMLKNKFQEPQVKKFLQDGSSDEAFAINNIPCRMMKVGQTFFSFNSLETRV